MVGLYSIEISVRVERNFFFVVRCVLDQPLLPVGERVRELRDV
jgi:hypothetical protein